MGRSKALIGSIATPSQRRTIDRGTTPRLTSVGYTDRCREVVRFLPLRDSPGGAVRCGWRRLSDHNERGVGLSPVARNTIRSGLEVESRAFVTQHPLAAGSRGPEVAVRTVVCCIELFFYCSSSGSPSCGTQSSRVECASARDAAPSRSGPTRQTWSLLVVHGSCPPLTAVLAHFATTAW